MFDFFPPPYQFPSLFSLSTFFSDNLTPTESHLPHLKEKKQNKCIRW